MTGSRDIEGMVVFPVGRVMNAWLVEEAIFAYLQAHPYLKGSIYCWWDGAPLFRMIDNL